MTNTLFTRSECVLLMVALEERIDIMKKLGEESPTPEFKKFWADGSVKYSELYKKVLNYRGYQEDENPEGG